MLGRLWILTLAVVAGLETRVSAGSFSAVRRSSVGQTLMGRRCSRRPFCDGVPNCNATRYAGVLLRCDEKFVQIREFYGADTPQMIAEATKLLSNSRGEKGAGKSGADFIRSPDGRYLLKTMSRRDFNSMKTTSSAYHKHVIRFGNTTMLVRVYAVIHFINGKKWMVMNNWLPIDFGRIYDLKGSLSGRRSKYYKRVQKDNNWLDHPEDHPTVPKEVYDQFVNQTKADTRALRKSALIDYSLVYGRERYVLQRCQPGQCKAPVCAEGFGCVEAASAVAMTPGDFDSRHWGQVHDHFCDATGTPKEHVGHACVATMWGTSDFVATVDVYCYGIIDLLKYFRKMATVEWITRGGAFGRSISAQPPASYRSRFIKFMSATFQVPGPGDPQRFLFVPDSRSCQRGAPWSDA